jgi:hypothetical protein
LVVEQNRLRWRRMPAARSGRRGRRIPHRIYSDGNAVNVFPRSALNCRTRVAGVALIVSGLWLACLPASGQNDSPLTPAPPRQVHRITTENRVEPAPLPPEQIIQAFVAREAECLRAHQNYGFKRSVRLEEFLPGGDTGGEILQTSVVYLAENGRRYEMPGETSKKNFVAANVAPEDLKSVSQVPLFPLVPEQMQYYNIAYKGSQPLDELHAYIFEVKPKRLLAGYRLFQGLVYVDDRDLAIVQLYGRWDALPDDEGANSDARRIPFTMYEIYYENVEGKLWFPTYIRADAYLHTKSGEDQLRLIVKMTDFKETAPAPAPAETSPKPADSVKPSSQPPAAPRPDLNPLPLPPTL